MLIHMLATRTGCGDGHTVRWFCRGHCYDVPDTLAKLFIYHGWARQVTRPGFSLFFYF